MCLNGVVLDLCRDYHSFIIIIIIIIIIITCKIFILQQNKIWCHYISIVATWKKK
jgi:hypothetical protein